MAKKRSGFEELFKKISLETQITELRPAVLRDVFSVANRKRAAAALNKELAHFEDTFIKTFINTHSQTPSVVDSSPNPVTGTGITSWGQLSKDWERKKKKHGLATPAFFHFGQQARLVTNGLGKGKNKRPAGQPYKNRPKITLEQYLKANWDTQTALNIVGRVEPEDIVFKNAKGEDVKLKTGKANLDKAFLGKLKTATRDITDVKETFTIGFRAFPKISVDKLGKKMSFYGLPLSKRFIPLSHNTAAKGFPLSKLTNNVDIDDGRRLRHTIDPLLNWYYRVKLPHVFKQFYKTKGLVGR